MTNPPLILVVDDEEGIVTGLCYRLKQAGFRTLGCFTGREGLEAARNSRPDVILLDQCLPELVGSDVLTELRRDPATRDIPVVILTGADVRQRDVLSSGAAALLRKPYRKDELLDVIESLLAQPEGIAEPPSWQTRKLF